jgi:hypothetical protein
MPLMTLQEDLTTALKSSLLLAEILIKFNPSLSNKSISHKSKRKISLGLMRITNKTQQMISISILVAPKKFKNKLKLRTGLMILMISLAITLNLLLRKINLKML